MCDKFDESMPFVRSIASITSCMIRSTKNRERATLPVSSRRGSGDKKKDVKRLIQGPKRVSTLLCVGPPLLMRVSTFVGCLRGHMAQISTG